MDVATALSRFEQDGRFAFHRSGIKTTGVLITCLVLGALFGWLLSTALPGALAPGAATRDIVAAVVYAGFTALLLGGAISCIVRFTRLKDRLVLTPTGFAVDGKGEIPWAAITTYNVTHQKGGGPDLNSVDVRRADGKPARVLLPGDLTVSSRVVVPIMQAVHARSLGG